MSERMKPEDVRPGMRFRDCDPRGTSGTRRVEHIDERYAYTTLDGWNRSRIRLDRLTNPRLYETCGAMR